MLELPSNSLPKRIKVNIRGGGGGGGIGELLSLYGKYGQLLLKG